MLFGSLTLTLLGSTRVVSNETSADLALIGESSGEVLKHIAAGKRPRGVRVSPSGREVFVALSGWPAASPGHEPKGAPERSAGGIGVVDAAAQRAVGEVKLPGGARPAGAALSPDRRVLYATTGRRGAVVAIGAKTGELAGAVPGIGVRPWGVAVSADGARLCTANGPSGEVAVVDAATGAVLRRISSGGGCCGLARRP